jgi:hypothetical protein
MSDSNNDAKPSAAAAADDAAGVPTDAELAAVHTAIASAMKDQRLKDAFATEVTVMLPNSIGLKAFAAIVSERRYQDATAAKWAHAGVPSLEAELIMVHKLYADAEREWYSSSDKTAALAVMRRIAAVCTRCLRNHGAPLRE